jgi:hypothetical protein
MDVGLGLTPKAHTYSIYEFFQGRAYNTHNLHTVSYVEYIVVTLIDVACVSGGLVTSGSPSSASGCPVGLFGSRQSARA